MIRRLRSVSLKGKLTAFVVLVALYLGTSLGIWYYRTAREALVEDLKKKAEAMTLTLRHNSRSGLLLQDRLELQRALAGVAEDEDILYAEVEDMEGKVLASRKREGEGALDAIPPKGAPGKSIPGASRKVDLKSLVLPGGEEIVEATAFVEIEQVLPREEPFTDNGGKAANLNFLGSVRVGFTMHRTMDRIRIVMRITLSFTLLVTLVAAALCYAAAWILMRPLGEIARRTRDVAAGNFQVNIPETRGDEIGDLARAFNRMVADLRHSREGLVRAKEEAEDIIRSAPDALLVLDLEGRVASLNPAADRLLHYAAEDLVGRPVEELFKAEEKEWLRPERLQELAEKGELRDLAVTLRSREGEEIPVQVSGSILRGEGGKAAGLLAFFRDMRTSRLLADLEKANRDLRDAQSRLVQGGKMAALGQMIAGIAHEINNPLTGVVGFAELLLRDRTSADRLDKGLHRILKEATRAKKIVQDLLVFAREHRPRKTTFPIATAVDRALDPLEEGFAAAKVAIDREREQEKDVPLVRADIDQLVQVFTNLFSNALQALREAPEGARRLGIRIERGEGTVRVRISDSGPGIPAAILEKIFEPFFTTRDVGKGTGLGLSISHSMIRSHGGSLTASSEPGRGATFVVELPLLVEVAAVEEGRSGGGASAPGERVILDLGVSGCRVLIVEKEEGVIQLVTEIFQSSGNRTETVKSTEAAIESIRRADYDLILCGTDVDAWSTERLYDESARLNPELKGRFVFLHGGPADAAIDAFLKRTGQVCLYKPFTMRELVLVAKQVLGAGPTPAP